MSSWIAVQIEKKPWQSIVLAFLLILLTTVFIVFLGKIVDHIPTLVSFDNSVYQNINLGPHPNWLNAIVSPFNFNFLPWGGTFIPSFLYFVFIIGFIFVLIFNRKQSGYALLALLVAIVVDSVLYKITNAYVIRDRPFLHLLNNLSDSAKAIWVHWPSYPSGHVRDMALYSTVLSGYAPKLTIIFFILTLWIAYTRIYLGAHYPTDALAGLLLGYGVGFGVLVMMKSVQRLIKGKKIIFQHE